MKRFVINTSNDIPFSKRKLRLFEDKEEEVVFLSCSLCCSLHKFDVPYRSLPRRNRQGNVEPRHISR